MYYSYVSSFFCDFLVIVARNENNYTVMHNSTLFFYSRQTYVLKDICFIAVLLIRYIWSINLFRAPNVLLRRMDSIKAIFLN